MLNRTNRKLSAKNSGLNLGTRSLAVKAGANFGKLTRHTAGRQEPARAGVVVVRHSVWLDAIVRSYPSIPMRATMPTGSSPQTHPRAHRGCGEGSTGQLAALASRPSARSLPGGANARDRFPLEPKPRFVLGQGQAGRIATARRRPLPRYQVPDAAP